MYIINIFIFENIWQVYVICKLFLYFRILYSNNKRERERKGKKLIAQSVLYLNHFVDFHNKIFYTYLYTKYEFLCLCKPACLFHPRFNSTIEFLVWFSQGENDTGTAASSSSVDLLAKRNDLTRVSS